jgi:hypothetical protein
MKLKCPACGTPIPSDNINIQNMTALCSHCDNVFTFKPVDARLSRKLKAPEQVTVHEETEQSLHFSFKWSWRTEPMFGIVMMAIVAMATIVMLSMLLTGAAHIVELLIPLLLGAFPFYYGFTLLLNSTHFHMDHDQLRVHTSPLWYPYYGTRRVPAADITRVTTERFFAMPGATAREAFFNVYAHTIDGDQIMLARGVNYEHAHYIAQEIQSFINTQPDKHDTYFDLSTEPRLADDPFVDDVDDNADLDTGENHLRATKR